MSHSPQPRQIGSVPAARVLRAVPRGAAATTMLLSIAMAAAATMQHEVSADDAVQTDPPSERSNDPAPEPAALPQPSIQPALEPQDQRLNLIREGSYLVDTKGKLEAHAGGLLWSFSPLDADGTGPTMRAKLILLPCSLLAEMQKLARSLPDRGVVFELTGYVTVYKGRNFLLPTSAPRVTGFEPPSSAAADHPVEAPSREPAGDGAAARSADEAEQQLQRALSSRGEAPAARAPDPSSRGSGAGVDMKLGDVDEGERIDEGTILASRRGTIARDAGGAWVFAFDADAEGVADPPLVLLPCLQLERIEEYARLTGANAPVLLSGRVYRYEGRGYILPAAFRIPAEHSRIAP